MSKLTEAGEEKKQSELAPKEISKHGPREGYFIFPFQAQKKEQIPEATARKGVKFELQLVVHQRWNVKTKEYEDISVEEVKSIRNAVKAWLTFGGVGARTRRGCGALQVIGNNTNEWLPPVRDKERIGSWMKSLIVGNPASTSHTLLKDATVIIGEGCKADNNLSASEVAWRTLGAFWARFRKGHIPPVRSNYDPTSNCDWDDYRKVLVKSYFPKSPRPSSLALAKPFLGLPIIYQWFDNAPYTKFAIEASETGRMSSPVILKPIMFADGSVCPMVAILSAPKPEKIAIDKDKVDLKIPTSDKVLTALGATDPLQAVTAAAKKIWGATNVIEVTL
jgi:CRISPR-associated protein Cmr1